MRKAVAALGTALLSLLLFSSAAGANVIPSDPRPADQVTVRMWCFTGTVTFTITGNGVSIPVGSTEAVGPDGKAELTFTLPQIAPGSYTMVGKGTACGGDPDYQVNVGFTVRSADGGGDPQYPPQDHWCTTDLQSVSSGGTITAQAGYLAGPVRFLVVETGQDLGTASAGTDGIAAVTFTAPATPGTYTVQAIGTSGTGAAVSVSTIFSVVAGSVTPVVTVAPSVSGDVQPAVQVGGITESRDLATTGSTNGALARTGSDVDRAARLAMIAIAAGAALLVASRRRLVHR